MTFHQVWTLFDVFFFQPRGNEGTFSSVSEMVPPKISGSEGSRNFMAASELRYLIRRAKADVVIPAASR